MQKFFTEAFAGTLIHDFWAPYESVETDDRQYCLVHLLRELEKVDQHNDSPEWQAFAKKLRRLIRDGIRLRKRPDFEPQRYGSRIRLIDRRLTAIAQWQGSDGEPVYRDADALRLAKRLRKHWDPLFTFLDKPEVPFENNFAERMIRPAVILRKEQSVEPFRAGRCHPSHPDEHLPHAANARARPHQDHRRHPQNPPRNQPTAAATRPDRCKRLKRYDAPTTYRDDRAQTQSTIHHTTATWRTDLVLLL